MSNGFTVEQMLERIERKLESVETKLDSVVKNGCAHRTDDLDRIKKLEDRTWLDRGIAGIAGAIAGLFGSGWKG